MVLSIIVYTITAVLMWMLCSNAVAKERRALRSNPDTDVFAFAKYPEYIWVIIVFAFVVGARYDTGIDHLSYLEFYEKLGHGSVMREDIEVGFLWLEKIFTSLGLHYFFWFAFWGALQIFFVMYSLRRHKEVLAYVCVMIMLGPYFMQWMNGIRQCVVVCMLVWLIEFTGDKKKLIPFVLFILLGATLHKSAIFLLPLYFIGFATILDRGPLVNFIILAVCIAVGMVPNFYDMLTPLQALFADNEDFSRYSYDLERLMAGEETRTVSFGPARLANLGVSIFIMAYYPKIKEFFKEPILDKYFVLFFLGTCLYNLFINTSYIFLRPIMYLTIFQLPLFGYCMVYLKKTERTLPYYFISLVAFNQAIIAAMKYGVTGGGTDLSDSFLYHFFFMQ